MNETIVVDQKNVEFTETIIPKPSVQLVATSPQQMAAAQGDLRAWLVGKLGEIDSEIAEVELAKAEAKKHKWKTSTFTNVISKAKTRRLFYEKTLAAVEAGLTIVPNMEVDIFAIRVTRERPTQGMEYNYNRAADYRAEVEDTAPRGDGEYVSTKPNVHRWLETEKDSQGKERMKNCLVPTTFRDAEFPVMAAHPVVMSATAQAMALKVFDRIGICPQSRRRRGKGDPLIIGQIVQRIGYSEKVVSFLIAWHLDLRTL